MHQIPESQSCCRILGPLQQQVDARPELLQTAITMLETVLLDRYRLIRPLGAGGFARTYLAIDQQNHHQPCVIKHLRPAQRSPHFLATARRLFETEVATLERLGHHDRIPALIDAFEVGGEFYLVQAYVEGDSLSAWFERQAPCCEADMIDLLQEALSILAFIHQQQVIHRDIKPSNLMRRHSDGKLMLIDFGAVKEITTQIHTDSPEQFTVSIGTQGYAPPEQLAGRPRYSSDLYALGMTVIRGLTGRSPTDLPEHPQTGELCWQEAVPHLSPGLRVFLHRLTDASVYQRYASAEAALRDLAQLEALAQPLSLDLPETALPVAASGVAPRRWPVAIALSLVTALVLLIRQDGGWMPLELMVYDAWTQRQPDAGPDQRLLLVEITEADLRALNRPTPSDATLNQALQILQAHQPRVIGLDLHRDLPQGEGQAALWQSLAADNVIAIRKLGGGAADAIPAPPTVSPEQVGFNDFPVDPDGVVRRNLLFAAADAQPDSEVLYSFALRLALAYLAADGISPQPSAVDPNYMELNGTIFYPLKQHFGGYRGIDDAGYQILLRYRAAKRAAPRLSLTALLAGQFEAEQIRNRIVIIGTTAPSAKDLFYTPLSAGAQADHLMPGVMLHVQATSQILSLALGEQRLPWALPETAEVVWILLWAGGGGLLGTRSVRLWLWGLGVAGGGLLVLSVPAVVFAAGGWLPVLPAPVAFVGTAVVAILIRHRPTIAQQGRTSLTATLIARLSPWQRHSASRDRSADGREGD